MARVCLLREVSISICHLFPGTQPAPSGKVPPEKLQHFQARSGGVEARSPVGRMTWVVTIPTFAAINYPAAECHTAISGSARILGISNKFSIFCIGDNFSSRLRTFSLGGREKSWNYQKWHVSEWPWFRLLNDWSSLRCNSSILVLCAGDMQRHVFLLQKNCVKDPKSQTCLGIIRDELKWGETRI